MPTKYRLNRERMVAQYIINKGVKSPEVIAAMLSVPRHYFVEEALQFKAYQDYPVQIGYGQTLSQPYIVAKMTELLEIKAGQRVLEIGTGSGYQAAVLSKLGAEVYSIERIKQLYLSARDLLFKLNFFNIQIKLDDGTIGWADKAPFDRIIVTAGGPEIPQPLIAQLSDPGILIIPIGAEKRKQRLIKISKIQGKIMQEDHGSVMFVDLVGNYGW